jgi:transposase
VWCRGGLPAWSGDATHRGPAPRHREDRPVNRDAFVIADAARTLPHTLRRVDIDDEALAELGVLVGFDDDLAQESTRLVNRIRGLLTHIHPALQRAIGPKTTTNAVLELLSRHGGPAGLRKAGQRKLTATAIKYAPRVGAKLVDAIMTALDEQTVVVPGTAAAETVLPRLADALREVLRSRDELAKQVAEILDAHPLAEVLISMPGIGIRTSARILLEVGDGPGAAHMVGSCTGWHRYNSPRSRFNRRNPSHPAHS